MPRRVIGLCYHNVTSQPRPHLQHLYRCKTPRQFARDLEFLSRKFTLVGYAELRDGRLPNTSKPIAVLTFDDGYAECHSTIRPLLKQYGVPAIFFVTTDFLDNRSLFYCNTVSLCIAAAKRYEGSEARAMLRDLEPAFGVRLTRVGDLVTRLHGLTQRDESLDAACRRLWIDPAGYVKVVGPYLTSAQVLELSSDGFTIGAHGTDHRKIDLFAPDIVEQQMADSCLAVARLVNAPEVPFAFPFGGQGVSRVMLNAARKRHPGVGLIFDSNQLAIDEDFVVNRITVDAPPSPSFRGTNLPSQLRAAYCREMLRAVVGARRARTASHVRYV